jgi:hypothetical protein
MTRMMPQPDLVDLHVHSTASDGRFTPRQIVAHAAEVGLKALALTDHDTVAGVPEALDAGRTLGVEVIAGVEISAEFEDGACHILGYFIDHANAALGAVLDRARGSRETRNAEILAKLRALGFDLTLRDVVGRATDGTLTRAHFAAAMMEKGYVRTWDEAFDKYLGRGRPAYVHRERVMPEDAVRAIRGAGGLAGLAHPRQLNRSVAETQEWVARFAAMGVEAIESSSPDHTANYARHYHEMAAGLGLLETGGTDWHGRTDTDISLGVGRGQMAIHYAVVQAMKDRLASRPSEPAT